MLRKAASVKRASTVAFNGSDSSSDSESDSFEAAMRKKSQKIADSMLNQEELQYDIDVPVTKEEKENKQVKGSKFLKDILSQKEIRDREKERSKIEWQRKNAKGMVFESEEYKRLAGDAGFEEEPTTQPEESSIHDLVKSKVTEQDLEEARERYFERHPETKRN